MSVNEADVDKWRVSPRETRAQAIFRARCNSRSGSVPRVSFRKRREDERGRKRRVGGGQRRAPPRLDSQKAAPLVVRVIDDRENMRARKKDPPLAASLLRGILSRRCASPVTVTQAVPVAATAFRSVSP